VWFHLVLSVGYVIVCFFSGLIVLCFGFALFPDLFGSVSMFVLLFVLLVTKLFTKQFNIHKQLNYTELCAK
jgi:hypothetical protein